MTRINVIPPEELATEHLVAEYRELPRVFKLAIAAKRREFKDPSAMWVPKTYTLGEGHVKFFYDKLEFCARRHNQLRQEMKRRGFKCNLPPVEALLMEAPKALRGDYEPTPEARTLNRIRIEQRLSESKARKEQR
jgi:deoxyribonuclease (pyrimidine dimer)